MNTYIKYKIIILLPMLKHEPGENIQGFIHFSVNFFFFLDSLIKFAIRSVLFNLLIRYIKDICPSITKCP